jgi:hypothetical protein
MRTGIKKTVDTTVKIKGFFILGFIAIFYFSFLSIIAIAPNNIIFRL